MRYDPWLTEISPADIEAAHQRKAAREALIAEQAAEITRLRAELATARWEGMEEVERHFRIAAAATPLGYEDHQRGASVYNWLMYCATTIAAIRAAAKDDRPSEEIIREDRDAWPDRQANDPIRAAAKEEQ